MTTRGGGERGGEGMTTRGGGERGGEGMRTRGGGRKRRRRHDNKRRGRKRRRRDENKKTAEEEHIPNTSRKKLCLLSWYMQVYSPWREASTARNSSCEPKGMMEEEGVRGSLPMVHCTSGWSRVSSGPTLQTSWKRVVTPSTVVTVWLMGKSAGKSRGGG